MTQKDSAADLLERAAGHLHAAADLAEALGGADVFSDWHGIAAQAQLTAAGVSHNSPQVAKPPGTVTGYLTAALESLDQIPPLTGPPDLLLWAWHIRELRDVARAMERR